MNDSGWLPFGLGTVTGLSLMRLWIASRLRRLGPALEIARSFTHDQMEREAALQAEVARLVTRIRELEEYAIAQKRERKKLSVVEGGDS